MSDTRPTVLQMNPFMEFLESELDERYEVVRWHESSAAEREEWLKEHANEVQGVATGAHIGCSKALMDRLPALRVIAVNGVGVDKVDVEHAASKGIRIGTAVGAPTEDTADLAVGLILALLREIPAAHEHVRSGKWPAAERPLARKVTGRRFGIVGLGQIGVAVAKRLAPFGPVAYTGPSKKPVPYEYVADLMELAHDSDILIVTCPANAKTRHLINAAVLDALGPDGWLINVARGAIVNEAALIDALEARRIAGAALDVFEDEPNVSERLRTSPHVVLVPHMGSATQESRRQMAELVLENLEAAFD